MIPRETKNPRSYQVLDQVIDRGEATDVARVLSCSPQLIRDWCRAPETSEEFSNTGKFNPLDRIRAIVSVIRESDGSAERAYPIGQYVANMLGGVFVPMPQANRQQDSELVRHVSAILKETGEAVEATRLAYFDKDTPGRISTQERNVCEHEIREAIVALVQFLNWVERGGK